MLFQCTTFSFGNFGNFYKTYVLYLRSAKLGSKKTRTIIFAEMAKKLYNLVGYM